LPNGVDENGNPLSDHDLLIRLDDRLEGLIPKIDRLDVGLRGDGTEENPGIIAMCKVHRKQFAEHLSDHKKTTKRLYALAGGLGAAASLIVDVLHRLGIL